MLRLKTLSLRNFKSVGDKGITVDFSRLPGLTMVMGENLDVNSGVDSRNGVGKSTLVDGLSFNWTGKPLCKARAGELVNNTNRKGRMLTVTEFDLGDMSYRVERGMPAHARLYRKPASDPRPITLEEDGVAVFGDSRASIAEVSEEIGRILRMDHNLFSCTVANGARSKTFFERDEKEQKGIVESLFGFTLLSEKGKAINRARLELEKRLGILSAVLAERVRANNKMQEQVDAVSARSNEWEARRRARAAELECEIAPIEGFDLADFERRWGEYEADLADINDCDNALAGLAAERLAEDAMFGLELAELNSMRREAAAHAGLKRREQAAAADELSRAREEACQTCHRVWDDLDAKRANADRIEEGKREIDRAVQDADEAVRAVDELVSGKTRELESSRAASALQLAEAHEIRAQLAGGLEARRPSEFASLDKAHAHAERESSLRARLAEIMAEPNPHRETLTELIDRGLDQVDYTEANELEVSIEHHRYLETLLTRRDSPVRRAITARWLPRLNAHLQRHLGALDLPHRVEFGDDLVPMISLGGIEIGFGLLSGGQTERFVLAQNWSFRDIFESMHFPLSVLMVDERLDNGLDGHGVTQAIGVLRRIAALPGRSVLVVSHRDDVQSCADQTLTVRLEGNFTSLEYEA